MRDRTRIQWLRLRLGRRTTTSTAKEVKNGDERFGGVDRLLFAFGLIFGAYPGHGTDESCARNALLRWENGGMSEVVT